MGMMAAKHTDLVVGMDMHMIQPPPPAPPVMVPHPVVGMILDPADYDSGACTVSVNGLPRARAGSVCMMSPPHIPIGGMFVMPPLSEAEVYQGSSTVTADGEAMSAGNHQVLGCHDVGAPAPVRTWKTGGATSLMKAGSVVIALPGGPPVFVGGAPTTSASGDKAGELETEPPERKARFHFFFDSDGLDLALRDVEVEVDGAAYPDVRKSGPRGDVELLVPLDAVEARVTFSKGEPQELSWVIRLHTLEPFDSDGGVKQRLANLGYLKSADAATDDELKMAIQSFRITAGLELGDAIDDAVKTALRNAHYG
jgi:uncharacterized Zn-binding protein involved in type VI secretion